MSASTPEARSRPSGTPICGDAPKTPRARGVLDGHEHRPAPLAAGRDLQDAQQQSRIGAAMPIAVRRQDADERRRHAHEDQRPHQHDAAPVLVAEVAREERAEGGTGS
jgi:hypothetical protein